MIIPLFMPLGVLCGQSVYVVIDNVLLCKTVTNQTKHLGGVKNFSLDKLSMRSELKVDSGLLRGVTLPTADVVCDPVCACLPHSAAVYSKCGTQGASF
jgi:hypothetical protein